MGDSYRQRLGMTGSVVGQAGAALKDGEAGRMKVVGKVVGAEVQTRPLRHFLPWVEKVIAQTRERLWKGNPHAPEAESVRRAHPGHRQRETRPAHRVWEAGGDR